MSTAVAGKSFREIEARIDSQLGNPPWLEFSGIDSEQRRQIVRELAAYEYVTKRAKEMPPAWIDHGDGKRIASLVRHVRKFRENLDGALHHSGVNFSLLLAYPSTAPGHQALDNDAASAMEAMFSSLQDLEFAGEIALESIRQEIDKPRRGAPGKNAQRVLIRELDLLIREPLQEGIEPELSWNRFGAETARAVVKLIGLVGIRVTTKTVENFLSRPKNSKNFKRISGIRR